MHLFQDLVSVLPLLPILVLGTHTRRPRGSHKLTLSADDEPHAAELSALMREFLEDRNPIDPSAAGLVRYLAPEDAITVTRCADVHLRFSDPRAKTHDVRPRQCRSFWCPWCIRLAHKRRTRYQYLKLQSIQPSDDDAVRLLNLVAELPQPLHGLVRHDEQAVRAWRDAIEWTIAEAYSYEGRTGVTANRACWRELGAIFNFHAIGDEGTPWPKYFPHFDILLSAYRVQDAQIVKLRTEWPEKYRRTRERYRANLRRFMLPLITSGPRRDAELEHFLGTRFDVIWHVGKPPQGAGEGHVHIRNAAHRIRYSCRPLFGLDGCKLETDEEGKKWLVYTPSIKSKHPIRHVSHPGPAFAALRDMKHHLGGKHSRFVIGALAGKAYARALKLNGRPKIAEQEKTGRKLVAAYAQFNGAWQRLEPRDLWRL